jgi:hypothetical protein
LASLLNGRQRREIREAKQARKDSSMDQERRDSNNKEVTARNNSQKDPNK